MAQKFTVRKKTVANKVETIETIEVDWEALLEKLDADSGVADTNYETTLDGV